MHDLLFANQPQLDLRALSEYASRGGLDVAGFGSCLNSDAVVDRIGRDAAEGKRLGVTSTPTFFLGLVGDHELKLTRKIVGLQGVDVFVQTIRELLKVSGTRT